MTISLAKDVEEFLQEQVREAVRQAGLDVLEADIALGDLAEDASPWPTLFRVRSTACQAASQQVTFDHDDNRRGNIRRRRAEAAAEATAA